MELKKSKPELLHATARRVGTKDVAAIRCFWNGKRVLTNKLTKTQALSLRIATRHLLNYLELEYG